MNTWNMFDPEIEKEMKSLRPHMGQPTSFKAQAKRELARRLVLEEENKWLKKDVMRLEIENDHLSEFIKWPPEEWECNKAKVPEYVMQHLERRAP